ncbi:hypothetical protein VNO78_31947 [Psophocarpus tetragonolobus]|uniref:F-box domain-containing protein n=1 Tax=Psophocarpus tetragonolobus TaxID=3891 RepID=A0AAN9X7S7_PSOTE
MPLSLDRFSSLPIELLLTILSLLPFKEAVRTFVLSKKWLDMKIYKSLRNIEFNEFFFVKLDRSDETREAQRKAFLEFIKIWIENHEGTLMDKFSLRLSTPANVAQIVYQCVVFATQHKVKDLELDFVDADQYENDDGYFDNYEAKFELPKQVYEHQILESLKLYACSFIETEIVNFHSLKEISLGWMEVSISAIKTLLLNCEKLQSLSFKRCWNSEKFDLGEEEIMALTKLVLNECRFEIDCFKVNAPNLKIFKYSGWMNFCTTKIHSLAMEEGELDFSHEYLFEGFGDPLYNLVKELRTVRVLTVCSFVLQVIPTGEEQEGMQCEMEVRHLIMKTGLHEDEFIGVAFFLNSCPMLECLTIELGSKNDLMDYEAPFNFNGMQFWIEKLGRCKCLRSSLKVVEINGFVGSMNERLMLKYLICRGFALKRIAINMLKDESGRTMDPHCRQIAQTLLSVPRASTNLDILIF